MLACRRPSMWSGPPPRSGGMDSPRKHGDAQSLLQAGTTAEGRGTLPGRCKDLKPVRRRAEERCGEALGLRGYLARPLSSCSDHA